MEGEGMPRLPEGAEYTPLPAPGTEGPYREFSVGNQSAHSAWHIIKVKGQNLVHHAAASQCLEGRQALGQRADNLDMVILKPCSFV